MRFDLPRILRWGLLALGMGLAVGMVHAWLAEESPPTATATTLRATSGMSPLEAKLTAQVAALRAQAEEAVHLRAQLASLEQSLDAKSVSAKEQRDRAAELRRQLDALNAQAEQTGRTQSRRRAQTKIFGPIVFAPGRTTLDGDGRALVSKVVRAIKAMDQAEVMVQAFADPEPLSPRNQARYGDNLGLATTRALAVARALFERGVDRNMVQVGATGHIPSRDPKSPTRAPDHTRWVRIKVSPLGQ